ncbi:MAG: hypothetical protein M1832_000067 [Thelocarpon impressellum]|nr:MAG: hypothetical protein M1832_000067 [Thelocarpon impressellum]
MVPQLASLQALKLARLKLVAVRCGINSSGPKSTLAARVHDELRRFEASQLELGKKETARILSIDMGIRNLAYCIFDSPVPSETSPSLPPSIVAWRKLAVSSAPSVTGADDSSPSSKESFEPSIYAAHAYHLLANTLLPHAPTQVLIERQRYRSMGGAAIQEWTVRVNMFEGMLHSVLRTLAEEGRWRGQVHSVSPAKVTPFWLGVDAAKAKAVAATVGTGSARRKAAKVDLVRKWLAAGDEKVLRLETPEAIRTAESFLRGKQSWRKGKERGTVEQGKLDDLADCLLQGLAWARWEDNKLHAVTRSVDGL